MAFTLESISRTYSQNIACYIAMIYNHSQENPII